jgi:2-polyprenyl-3-methyl-5-hydroxy-6-metoxy-1,4-benzoquinol methylase
MNDWKHRLYNNYVSTGQAGEKISQHTGLNMGNSAYYSSLINKHLPSNKDISILDLACGHGALILRLKQLGYSKVVGVDISPEQVNLAHNLGLTEVKCQDIMAFLSDKTEAFDVIFLMDILEHLTKQELFDCLDNVMKSLTTNGMLVIHVPNAEGIFGMRIRYGDLTHENCFTPQSISQALTACGMRNIECFEDKPVIHGVKSYIRYVLWGALTAPLRLLLAAETGTTKSVLSQNMLVVARKVA